jgi:protein-L-isoaspartate(D-aspartate) O-methyltransferase
MTSQRARDRLVERLKAEGIQDHRVLEVIRVLPRHLFVDEGLALRAYEDSALPIGQNQTISQPWVVARMTEALIEKKIPRKVLEIGTGSGYQAAVLSQLVEQVYSVERIMSLWRQARTRFRNANIRNVRSRHDDGRDGWAQEAPFDAIMITAACAYVDPKLIEQLALDGVLIAPVGPPGNQQLIRMYKENETGLKEENLGQVSFVPLLSGLS